MFNDDIIKLLVADSDTAIRKIIRVAAEEMNWACEEAPDGITALKLLRHNSIQLAIVDYNLAELNGVVVCRQIRKLSTIPVIFLGQSSKEADRLASFEAGGNDYVLKPFYPRELVARIKSLLSFQGYSQKGAKVIVHGNLSIDITARSVMVDGNNIVLTPKEYDLLLFFCQNPSKAFSRDALLNYVWGDDFVGTDRTVDSHVRSLRSKIRPYHYYIITLWGIGYKFE